MALDERQLSTVLQATTEKAIELIEADGGFRPFGARAKASGEIEFVQIEADGEGETAGEIHRRLGEMLAEEARGGELLGAALVANTRVSGVANAPAIVILLETPGFSRSIVVPYQIAGAKVAPGRMIPDEAEPMIFRR
jgi:hypothetical protein